MNAESFLTPIINGNRFSVKCANIEFGLFRMILSLISLPFALASYLPILQERKDGFFDLFGCVGLRERQFFDIFLNYFYTTSRKTMGQISARTEL